MPIVWRRRRWNKRFGTYQPWLKYIVAFYYYSENVQVVHQRATLVICFFRSFLYRQKGTKKPRNPQNSLSVSEDKYKVQVYTFIASHHFCGLPALPSALRFLHLKVPRQSFRRKSFSPTVFRRQQKCCYKCVQTVAGCPNPQLILCKASFRFTLRFHYPNKNDLQLIDSIRRTEINILNLH